MRGCRPPALLVSLLLLLHGPARAGGESDTLRVVVYELKVTGLDDRISQLVSDSLLAEIRKLANVAAMGMDEIAALLSVEEQRQLVGCDDESCMAEVAGALGSEEMIVGSMGRLGSSTVLSLKRLDMKTTGLRQSYSKTMDSADAGNALLASIGDAVQALYPERPLRQGEARGVSPETVERLNPPPLPTWVFWTTLSTAAAMGLAAGGLGYAQQRTVGEYNDKVAGTASGSPSRGSEFLELQDRADGLKNAAIGVGAAAGALVITAVIEALFTDWWGYGEESASAAPVIGRGMAGATVSFSLP